MMLVRTVIATLILLAISCERNPQIEEPSSGDLEDRISKVSAGPGKVKSVGGGKFTEPNGRNSLNKLLEEKKIDSKVLDRKVSLKNLEKIFKLVDNGDFSEDEFEELLTFIFHRIELPAVKELATIVGRQISSSSLPNSATIFSKVLAKTYHERPDWNSGDILERLLITGPYGGLLIMEVGPKMVSGDDPTRAFFELLASDFEGRSKSDYGPLVRFSASKLTASDLDLIEQVPVNRHDDFGGMIVGAVAKKLIWKAPEKTVDYIQSLPDSLNREVAVFELAKFSVFLDDAEAAGEWFSELGDEELRRAVKEFATQKGLKLST